MQSADSNFEMKRQAVRILEFMPYQETADLLLHVIARTEDHAFRFIMLSALNRLHDKEPKIKMNHFLIKSEISKEVQVHIRLHKLHTFCSKEQIGRSEYLGMALKTLMDESFERIFRCLILFRLFLLRGFFFVKFHA